MPGLIRALGETPEIAAVNVILGSIGEAPLDNGADLATAVDADTNVAVAVGLLKESTREVLATGWRFNTFYGVPVAPTFPEQILGDATLNIFQKPEGVLSWRMTPCPEMQGVDLVECLSTVFLDAGETVPVLFDRLRNRDGVDAARYPFVYLDVVREADFENMPEVARRYATILAARRMCQRVATSDLQASFTRQDESLALRALKREQGTPSKLNLFNTADAFEIGGRRPRGGGGYMARVFPGGS